MFKATAALRKHMSEKFGLAADATDADVAKSVGINLAKGLLDPAVLADLSKAEQAAPAASPDIATMVDAAVTKAMAPIGELVAKLTAVAPQSATQPPAAGSAPPTGSEDARKAMIGGVGTGAEVPEEQQHSIRVKAAVERYDDTRTTLTYAMSANDRTKAAFGHTEVRLGSGDGSLDRILDVPTKRNKAIAGAWFKRTLAAAYKRATGSVPRHMRLTEHDQQLIEYAAHECKFVGPLDWNEGSDDARTWVAGEKLSDFHRKALLDDSASGGLEAVPIEFDDVAITTPLLNGEIFPRVDVRNVTRRRIEAFSIGNPTLSWGTSEGTEISPFDTSSFISAFDNNIYPLTGAIEIGLDFDADSPVAMGDLILSRYGIRMAAVLDNVIVSGDGTSSPQGVFTASGTTAVSTTGGAGAAPQIDDYEKLFFGVPKQYHTEPGAANKAVFIGTETSYRRCRGIPVNSSSDARRIFGMDHASYEVMDRPYAINESIANTKIAFVCLNRYRMYRRLGYETRIVTEDRSLALANKQLIVVRSRWGGALELGAAMAKITDAQA